MRWRCRISADGLVVCCLLRNFFTLCEITMKTVYLRKVPLFIAARFTKQSEARRDK